MKQVVFGRALSLRFALVAAIVLLATAQAFGTAPPVSAQGTATIEITNIDAGSGQPAAFTRFQATSENGTVYGPLETDLNGYVAFSVTVDPQGTSFTVEEETPPACGTAPDPQTTDPLAAGETTSLSFSTQDNPGCGLGTIALYAMACPDGFSGPADSYDPWRDGCTGTNDGTGFTLTSVASGESWNPVAGGYGIPGRAPVSGLPAGDYTFQQNGDAPSAAFCLVYDTSNYATSPEPSSVIPVPLTDGIGTITLSGNRVSCDVFTAPGGVAPISTEPASDEVQPASGATLDIHLAACPPGYLAGDTIYGDCHGNGISDQPVQVSADNGFSGTIATSLPESPGPGIASFTGLADGAYTITTNVPENTAVFVYCTDAGDLQIPASFDDTTQSLTLDLAAGDAITCDWYELPAVVQPAANETSLQVTAFNCPETFNPDASTSLETFQARCLDPTTGGAWWTLTRTGETGVDQYPDPGTDPPGVMVWDGLQSGDYQLQTSIPGEWNDPYVFCGLAGGELAPFGGGPGAHLLPIDASQGTYSCEWFNVPEVFRDGPGGPSSLEIHALACPAGTDPAGDLYGLCHDNGVTDVDFAVTGGDGFSGSQTTWIPTSPGPGVATFDDLVAGSYSVTQSEVDPSTSIVVYCSMADSDEIVPFAYDGFDTIALDLPADTGVVCDFYTIPPADASTTLQVTKYTCPVGMDADENTSLAAFQQACTTTTNDVDFTLAPLGQQGSTLTTGSAGEGAVLFEGLPSGNFGLTEDIPGDFNTPFAFCGLEGGQLEPYTWIRGGDPLAIDASAGTYACLWYNVPADAGQPSSITVTKYLCPEGTISGYQSRCGSSPLEGATFVLDGPGSYDVDLVTGADGNAWWGELTSGSYTLTEIPPSGVNVAVYVVSCEAGGQDFETTYNDRNGMRIELELPAGTDVTCNWYNIPPGTPTVTPGGSSGSITVHKFLCQGKSVNAYNWDADCTTETTPVGFSLKSVDGRPIAVGTTDSSGVLKYTNLANGAYSLDETSGDWCHAESDLVDSAGNVLVANSGNTDVYIYNCSVKQVGTLPSTGTGPATPSAAASFDGDKLWQLLLAAGATLGIALAMRHHLQRAVIRSGDSTDEVVLAVRPDEMGD